MSKSMISSDVYSGSITSKVIAGTSKLNRNVTLLGQRTWKAYVMIMSCKEFIKPRTYASAPDARKLTAKLPNVYET